MGALIQYDDFIDDLKKNVVFKGESGGDFGDFSKGIKCRLPVHEHADTEIYGLDGSGSDYFYYKGEKMCFYGGLLVSYGHNSVLKRVQGYVDAVLLEQVSIKTQEALVSYRTIYECSKTYFVFNKTDFRDDVTRLAGEVYDSLFDLFKESVTHCIDTDVKKKEVEIFLDKDLLSYDMKPDWSASFFESFFNIHDVWKQLVSDFKPDYINNKFHVQNAGSMAWAFRHCSQLKSGLRFSNFENWCSIDPWSSPENKYFNKDWSHKLKFLHALIDCFKESGNTELAMAIRGFLDAGYQMGASDKKAGMSLKVYKEHYSITLPAAVSNIVLVYMNKYAPERLKESLDYNKKFAA